MPNPLTDELSDESKAELSAMFAAMRARFGEYDPAFAIRLRRIASRRRPWWER
jgi:hypothetical protein